MAEDSITVNFSGSNDINIDLQGIDSIQCSSNTANLTSDLSPDILTADFVQQNLTVQIQTVASTSYSGQLSVTAVTGADCSGFDGEVDRQITAAGAVFIVVDSQFLHPSQYAIVGNVITFLINIWDEQKIMIWKQLA